MRAARVTNDHTSLVKTWIAHYYLVVKDPGALIELGIVELIGIEPTTSGLQSQRSPN